jgi:xanthine dehydrogenase accessory factor
VKRAIADRLLAARAAGEPVVLATVLNGGDQRVLALVGKAGSKDLDPAIAEAARAAILADKSRVIDCAAGRVFLNVFNPPLRLAVVGAVHIAQALAPMAARTGFAVTVVDPRGAFATAERFPGVALDDAWPDEAMARWRPGLRSAVVTLTHDPKLDDPALAAALRSDAFYIGALGSRKTHAGRLERLAAQGFPAAELARIHGPVGLDIGAVSPAEIAISILADIVAALRRPPTTP